MDEQGLFYQQLPSFTHFSDISDLKNYRELPTHWFIVITDIQGSTKAIEKGQYKAVNNIGVASIIAVINAVKPLSIPYVFGGDGASLCIPEHCVGTVKKALIATQKMAKEQFGLSLRIGVVPYADIKSAAKVLIGKHQITPHFEQAMFTGNGMAEAEKWVKVDAENCYAIGHDEASINADFTGFECRWNQIESPHGETLSLLVSAIGDNSEENHELYQEVLGAVNASYGEIRKCCPIQKQYLRLSSGYKILSNEIRIRTHALPLIGKLKYAMKLPFINLLGRYFMANNKVTGKTHWGNYKDTLIKHTDYRKFDDMLRMVISGTTEQRQKLTEYLEGQLQNKKLAYGIHVSPAALITCMISDYNVNHVHFIDGSHGGYAMAAKQLKSQLATSA